MVIRGWLAILITKSHRRYRSTGNKQMNYLSQLVSSLQKPWRASCLTHLREYTDVVDEVMLKIVKTPVRKVKIA